MFDPTNKKCLACWNDYADAFTLCGGSVDKVCIRHCDNAESVKILNQTKD